eukprot:jgi/Bigna1/135567/aug1.30_g10275
MREQTWATPLALECTPHGYQPVQVIRGWNYESFELLEHRRKSLGFFLRGNPGIRDVDSATNLCNLVGCDKQLGNHKVGKQCGSSQNGCYPCARPSEESPRAPSPNPNLRQRKVDLPRKNGMGFRADEAK